MIQRSILLCLFGLAIGNLANQPLLAQSLFERRSQNQVDQYRGYVARDRGDVLTVLINESTDVENRDERRLDKSSSATANAQFNYGLGGDLGKSAASLTYGQLASSARDFSGDTEFRSERQFSDRFAVTVDDVLPNGNLVVSGKRLITVQGDLRELRLNGIVRQYDVLPNNVVPSSLVADLRIQLDAKGAEQAFSNQGWFSKRVNRWWPF